MEPSEGFPIGLDGKEFVCNARDPGLIPGLGRPPREGNGNPLQSSCLENHMNRGAWQASVHGIPRARHDLATKPPPPSPRKLMPYLGLLHPVPLQETLKHSSGSTSGGRESLWVLVHTKFI